MPGVDLNLDLPSLSDPFVTIATKLIAALAVVEQDLAGKVIPSEIDINASLSMAGNSLTSIGSLQLLGGNPPSAPGAIWYENGEFYVRDATGVVQITSNGSLNTAAVGTIVGDYGGGNPARVSFNDLAGEYSFTEDTGVYADIVCDDLILRSATGSVRFSVDNIITTARQFNVKTLPGAGISALIYNAATSTLETADSVRVTNDVKVTNLDYSGTLKHGDITVPQDFTGFLGTGSAGVVSNKYTFTITTGGTVYVPIRIPWIANSTRLKKIEVVVENDGTLPTLSLLHQREDASLAPIAEALTQSSTAINGGSHFKVTGTPTVIGPYAAGIRPMLKIVNNAAAPGGQLCFNIYVTYDRQ